MKREWKPGDVVLVRQSGHDRLALRNPDEWLDECGDAWEDSAVEMWGRPIVVIDPEDRDQVERLHQSILHIYGQQKVTDAADNTTLMQAALREFANPTPPKPEEPMGLGAVVATEGDGDFIRVRRGPGNPWLNLNPWLNVRTGAHYHWGRVPAVRVLSEGVAS